jgi:hypothetical protein
MARRGADDPRHRRRTGNHDVRWSRPIDRSRADGLDGAAVVFCATPGSQRGLRPARARSRRRRRGGSWTTITEPTIASWTGTALCFDSDAFNSRQLVPTWTSSDLNAVLRQRPEREPRASEVSWARAWGFDGWARGSRPTQTAPSGSGPPHPQSRPRQVHRTRYPTPSTPVASEMGSASPVLSRRRWTLLESRAATPHPATPSPSVPISIRAEPPMLWRERSAPGETGGRHAGSRLLGLGGPSRP